MDEPQELSYTLKVVSEIPGKTLNASFLAKDDISLCKILMTLVRENLNSLLFPLIDS